MFQPADIRGSGPYLIRAPGRFDPRKSFIFEHFGGTDLVSRHFVVAEFVSAQKVNIGPGLFDRKSFILEHFWSTEFVLAQKLNIGPAPRSFDSPNRLNGDVGFGWRRK